MGQSVAAVAYGVIMDRKLQDLVDLLLRDESGDWVGFEDEKLHGGPNADDPMMDKFDVLGFVVAIGADNCEHPGARIMYPWPTLPLADVSALEEALGMETVAEGKRKWAKLAGVAGGRSLELPEPTYLLTTVETA